MKKKYLILLMLSVFFCFTQAQTTHFIDWELSVGADATITIDVGDEIVWTNVDLGMPHNVVSNDPNAPPGFGSGLLGDNDTYSFTFNSAVVFDYGCGFHPGSMDGTITVLATGGGDCGTEYFDTGGPGGTYSNNEDIVWTFNPDTPGDVVTVTFTFVDIETSTTGGIQGGCWDFLTVYDGPDITAPVIANTLCGRANGAQPSVPSSLLSIGDFFTSTHPTGAITFRFRSDASVTLQGWAADVTCAPPVVATCDAPTNLLLNNVTDTTADFSWTPSPDETGGYEWVVMLLGDDPNTDPPVDQGSVTTGITTATATGLTPDTMYQAYVKTFCTMGNESSFSTPLNFTTDEEECEALTNLAIDNLTDTIVAFSWLEPVNTSNILGYGAIIVLAGGVPFVDNHVAEEFYNVGVASAAIPGLQPDTTYDLYMASVCSMVPLIISDFEMVTFITDDGLSVQDNERIKLSYFPNPTSGILTIDAFTVIESVEVFTLRGQKVLENHANQQSLQLDLTNLAQGVYMLKAYFDDGAVKAFRIIRE